MVVRDSNIEDNMTTTRTVYVKLLDEGTDAWRPVEALELEDGSFELGRNKQDQDEKWEFPSGSRVICSEKIFSDGTSGLVATQLVKR